MRSIHELLKLLEKYTHLFLCGDGFNRCVDGLCLVVVAIHEVNIVNDKERKLLLTYIKDNPPDSEHRKQIKLRQKAKAKAVAKGADPKDIIIHWENYYWKPGEQLPRLRWIKHHIKKTAV